MHHHGAANHAANAERSVASQLSNASNRSNRPHGQMTFGHHTHRTNRAALNSALPRPHARPQLDSCAGDHGRNPGAKAKLGN